MVIWNPRPTVHHLVNLSKDKDVQYNLKHISKGYKSWLYDLPQRAGLKLETTGRESLTWSQTKGHN